MNSVELARCEIIKCSRCGKCLSLCPTYQVTTDEKRVARGRVALAEAVLNSRLRYTPKLKESIQSCLKCLRCCWACPSGVEVQTIITLLRQHMPRKYGLSLWNRFVFRYVLPRRKLTDIVVRLACLFQFLLPGKRGTTRHIPLLFKGRRRIPHLASRTALQQFGSSAAPAANSVYLFTGCMMNYAYPEMIESAIRVLEELGHQVIVPQDQLCCGTPVLSLGDVEGARRLAELNVKVFAGDSPIIVPCASCGKTLKDEYTKLLGKEGEKFTRRVFGFSEFVSPRLDSKIAPLEAKALYHDPCHLRYGRDIADQPRDILGKAAEYLRSEGEDLCCGMGGLFSVHHYGMSSRIADRKVEAIRKTEADVLVTECPGCVLQLRDQLARRGIDLPVRHIAEILAEALDRSTISAKR
jgi:glycolate oxidase iron-sulfur subunit